MYPTLLKQLCLLLALTAGVTQARDPIGAPNLPPCPPETACDCPVGQICRQSEFDVRFGSTVAAAADVIAITSLPADVSGAAHVTTLVGATKSTFSAPVGVPDSSHGYGAAMALSPDGTLLAVGSPDAPRSDGRRGVVYIYARSGDRFNPTPVATLGGVYADLAHDRFGAAMSFDQDVLLVGAPGTSSAVPSGGSVAAFTRAGSTLTFSSQRSAFGVAPNSDFGAAVAARYGYAAIGAPSEFDGQGRIHLLRLLEGQLLPTGSSIASLVAERSDAKGIDGNKFGTRVGLGLTLHGLPLLVGTKPGADESGPDAGGAELYEIVASDALVATAEIRPPVLDGTKGAGQSLAITRGSIFIGAPATPESGTSDIGRALEFEFDAFPPFDGIDPLTNRAKGASRVVTGGDRVNRSPAVAGEFGREIVVAGPDLAVSAPASSGIVEFPEEIPSFDSSFEPDPWIATNPDGFPVALNQTTECSIRGGGTDCFEYGGIITLPPDNGIGFARFAVPAGAKFFAVKLTEYENGGCRGSAVAEVRVDGMTLVGFGQDFTVLRRIATALPSGSRVLELRSIDTDRTAQCDDTLWLDARFEN